MSDIEYVLRSPNDWFVHDGNKVAISRQGHASIPSVRIDFGIAQDGVRVLSVYRQNKMLEEVGLAGASRSDLQGSLSPERPTVADYLHRLSVPSAQSAVEPPTSFIISLPASGVDIKKSKAGRLQSFALPNGEYIWFRLISKKAGLLTGWKEDGGAGVNPCL